MDTTSTETIRILNHAHRRWWHLGDRSFGVAGPYLWNSLPAELRQQDICLTEFRRLLKTFLFAETRRIVTSLF